MPGRRVNPNYKILFPTLKNNDIFIWHVDFNTIKKFQFTIDDNETALVNNHVELDENGKETGIIYETFLNTKLEVVNNDRELKYGNDRLVFNKTTGIFMGRYIHQETKDLGSGKIVRIWKWDGNNEYKIEY